jgi:RNase P subunit RPR2
MSAPPDNGRLPDEYKRAPCPSCHECAGDPVSATTVVGEITIRVRVRCATCGHEWTSDRPTKHDEHSVKPAEG